MSATVRASTWEKAGLLLLMLAAAWSGRLVTLGGLHFTGDRLVGLAAVLALGVVLVRRGLHWTPVHSALIAFTGIQLLTSLLAASQWPRGPKLASIYVLGFSCFALAAEWARGRDELRQAARSWVAVGAVLGLAGALVAPVANLHQVQLWGTVLSQVLRQGDGSQIRVFAARATFNEQNLYSSFLLVAFALALWAWQPSGNGRARSWSGWLSVSGITLGLVFGLTRSAWVAMAGITLFWLWARRPALRQLGTLALVVAVGLLVQDRAIGASPLHFRVIEPIVERSDHNLSVRAIINRATIQSWLERPLLGKGAGSINNLLIPEAGPKPWNGNLSLFVLHDSGLVGAAALALVLIAVALMVRRGLRRSPDRAVLVPLHAAGVALLWAYQFTHALWLMYPYVYLGLLIAAIDDATPIGQSRVSMGTP